MPAARNTGEEWPLSWHHEWDDKVRAISGGLTILQPAIGKWVCSAGRLKTEPMIPVRIACSEERIHQIARMTKSHYEQEAVFYYRIGDKVFVLTDKGDGRVVIRNETT